LNEAALTLSVAAQESGSQGQQPATAAIHDNKRKQKQNFLLLLPPAAFNNYL
jgi:hypothetical protein